MWKNQSGENSCCTGISLAALQGGVWASRLALGSLDSLRKVRANSTMTQSTGE